MHHTGSVSIESKTADDSRPKTLRTSDARLTTEPVPERPWAFLTGVVRMRCFLRAWSPVLFSVRFAASQTVRSEVPFFKNVFWPSCS